MGKISPLPPLRDKGQLFLHTIMQTIMEDQIWGNTDWSSLLEC